MHDSPKHYAPLLVSGAGNDVPNIGVPLSVIAVGQQLSNSKEGAQSIKSGLSDRRPHFVLLLPYLARARLLNQLSTKGEEDGKEEMCLRRRRHLRRRRPGVGVCCSGDSRYNCDQTSSLKLMVQIDTVHLTLLIYTVTHLVRYKL